MAGASAPAQRLPEQANGYEPGYVGTEREARDDLVTGSPVKRYGGLDNETVVGDRHVRPEGVSEDHPEDQTWIPPRDERRHPRRDSRSPRDTDECRKPSRRGVQHAPRQPPAELPANVHAYHRRCSEDHRSTPFSDHGGQQHPMAGASAPAQQVRPDVYATRGLIPSPNPTYAFPFARLRRTASLTATPMRAWRGRGRWPDSQADSFFAR